MPLLAQVNEDLSALDQYKSTCSWAMKYMDQYKKRHFEQLDDLRKAMLDALQKQEEKLRKLSIEYDEELYPHLVSAVAERR